MRQLREAINYFVAKFDQLEAVGLELVNEAIDEDNDESAAFDLCDVFSRLAEDKAIAMQNKDRTAAMAAVFGLIGVSHCINSIIQNEIKGVSDERET